MVMTVVAVVFLLMMIVVITKVIVIFTTMRGRLFCHEARSLFLNDSQPGCCWSSNFSLSDAGIQERMKLTN